jgi:hypothetical protein
VTSTPLSAGSVGDVERPLLDPEVLRAGGDLEGGQRRGIAAGRDDAMAARGEVERELSADARGGARDQDGCRPRHEVTEYMMYIVGSS